MITFQHKGDFSKTESFLNKIRQFKLSKGVGLDKYGKMGVNALMSATPIDSGRTAASWDYKIEVYDGGAAIYWTNDNINKNVNIAVILQYGHGTRNGGYVRGRDYINPAIQPIFDEIADKAWSEVTD